MRERIIQLLKSIDIEMVVLGATLLQTIPTEKEQIEIFEEICDSTLHINVRNFCKTMRFKEGHMISVPYIWTNIIGNNWVIYTAEGSSKYLLISPYYTEKSKNIDIRTSPIKITHYEQINS